jgi:hypothetical protein
LNINNINYNDSYTNKSFVTSNNKINIVFVFLDENGQIIKEYFNKDNNLP